MWPSVNFEGQFRDLWQIAVFRATYATTITLNDSLPQDETYVPGNMLVVSAKAGSHLDVGEIDVRRRPSSPFLSIPRNHCDLTPRPPSQV